MLPSSASTNTLMAFPFDDYAAATLLFVFGIVHLRAAWNHDGGSDFSSFPCEKHNNNQHNFYSEDVYVSHLDESSASDERNNIGQQEIKHNSDGNPVNALKVPLRTSAVDIFEPTSKKENHSVNIGIQKMADHSTESLHLTRTKNRPAELTDRVSSLCLQSSAREGISDHSSQSGKLQGKHWMFELMRIMLYRSFLHPISLDQTICCCFRGNTLILLMPS